MIKILFSCPDKLINEIDSLNKLLMSDEVDYFHLKKPDFDYFQIKDFLQSIDEDLHYKVVIHSHYGLVNEFNLAGVNLDKKTLSQIAYADEVDKCFIQPLVLNGRGIEINRQVPNMVTYSGCSLSEIEGLPFDIEYAFLISDIDNISNAELEIKEVLKETKVKIIAKEDVTFLSVEHLQSSEL